MIRKKKMPVGLFVFLLILFLILGYLAAGVCVYPNAGLGNFQELFLQVVTHPFRNYWNSMTPTFLGIVFLAWILFLAYYMDSHRNTHQGIQHGSAEWADPAKVSRELTDPEDPQNNRILSKNVKISLEGERSLSNNNGIFLGSPGAGKTMMVIAENLLLMSSSYICLDPKGELLGKFGNYLEQNGYQIRVLNMRDMNSSNCYDPIRYIHSEDDIPRLVTNIFASVDPPDSAKSDPFWDQGCAMYLSSLFYFVWMVPQTEKREILSMAQKGESVLIRDHPDMQTATINQVTLLAQFEMETAACDSQGKQRAKDAPAYSILNKIVDILSARDSLHEGHPCVRDYRKLKGGAQETVRSIVLILNAKLAFFNTPGIRRIFSQDEMYLEEIGAGKDYDRKTKTALFLVPQENNTSYNFIFNMLYQQLFDRLIELADMKYEGRLPLRVELFMDEFANGIRPERFENLITTLRSRNIAALLFIQSVSQLKSLYKGDAWDILMDACSHLVFLGCGRSALSTQKYISELLDASTIEKSSDTVRGSQGGSVSYDGLQRSLMTPSEVGRMDRRHCILFLEGHQPIYDLKYRPFKDENFKEAMGLGPYLRPDRTRKTGFGKVFSQGERRDFQILTGYAKEDYMERTSQSGSRVFQLEEEEFLAIDIPDLDVESEKDGAWNAAQIRASIVQEAENYMEQHQEERPEIEENPETDKSEDGSMDGTSASPAAEEQAESEPEKPGPPDGDIYDWIVKNLKFFTAEQQNELTLAMKHGLEPGEVETMVSEPADRMKLIRTLFEGERPEAAQRQAQ